MGNTIKNIIFDFGGVIFDIDHAKVEKAFRGLGLNNFEELFSQASQTTLFQDFEKGIISPAVFRQQLKNLAGLDVSDAVLDATWNEILCDYPPHRIDLLKSLAKNYRLFLLSNTNSIHFDHYTALFQQRFGYDFLSLFEETYWSFKMGKRKPDADPYLHILHEKNLKPQETVFIDDSIQNIRIAEELNIFAVHLKDGMDVTGLFDNGILRKDFYA